MAKPQDGGVFIVWDEEEVEAERRGVGTKQDRTVVTGRFRVPKYARWTNEITDESIASAERYADSIATQHDNVRVEVIRH